MGMRVHVVKKVREYGDTEAFNWKNDEFRNLIDTLGGETTGEEYSTDWEVEEDRYVRCINILKRLNENDAESWDDVDFSDLFEGEDYSADNISADEVLHDLYQLGYHFEKKGDLDGLIKIMEQFYEERDKNSHWVQFSAW